MVLLAKLIHFLHDQSNADDCNFLLFNNVAWGLLIEPNVVQSTRCVIRKIDVHHAIAVVYEIRMSRSGVANRAGKERRQDTRQLCKDARIGAARAVTEQIRLSPISRASAA